MEDTRPTTDRTREQEYDKAIYAAKSGQRHPIDHQRIAYFHTKSYAEQLTASSAYARLNDEEWQSFLKRTR